MSASLRAGYRRPIDIRWLARARCTCSPGPLGAACATGSIKATAKPKNGKLCERREQGEMAPRRVRPASRSTHWTVRVLVRECPSSPAEPVMVGTSCCLGGEFVDPWRPGG